ncbi:conserved hypothetical protein [Vibrio chagasii]|nr:conserved hypothetical protein [Vibrio chagasii]
MDFDVSKALLDGGSFDIIRRRLINHADKLNSKVDSLNSSRRDEFGGGALDLAGSINLLTPANCTPVDMARVGSKLLFGFETKLGIKSKLEMSDIFAVYQLQDNNEQLTEIPLSESFLSDSVFKKDLEQLLTYNKSARLKQLYRKNDQLYILFSLNDSGRDYQFFSFDLANAEKPAYLGHESGRPKAESTTNFAWQRLSDSDTAGTLTKLFSLDDSLYIGTEAGKLIFKVNDNSANGMTILEEDLQNSYQRLNDMIVHMATEGNLVFAKVKALDEPSERYYIFNKITQKVVRADGIANGVQSLPEDHGVIFSNGFALSSGEVKIFSNESSSLELHNLITSPNGEDSLYFFFDVQVGGYTIYHYNMINKNVSSPMHACGYALRQNGELFMFRTSQNSQPEKLHKLQVWGTPFMSQSAYAAKSSSNSDNIFRKIGNASLVRGISDVLSILKLVRDEDVSAALYEGVIKTSVKAIDSHHWFANEELGNFKDELSGIQATSELVLDEFNKTIALARTASDKLVELKASFDSIVHEVNVLRGEDSERYLDILQKIKGQIGVTVEAKEIRFINTEEVAKLELEIIAQKDKVVESLVALLQRESSFKPFYESIKQIQASVNRAEKTAELAPELVKIDTLTSSLTALNDEVSEIEVEDTTKITFIIEQLSHAFTQLNTLRSVVQSKTSDFARIEAQSEFAAQMKQLDQMIEVGQSRITTPSECDTELAKLTAQFEKLETRFAEFEDYIEEVINKRKDTYSNIESRKTQLTSAIKRRIDNTARSAGITLKNISQRANRLESGTQLQGFFSSDQMITKVRDYASQIEEMGDTITAAGLLSQINAIREQAARDIRDKEELFEDNGRIVKMGKHKFAVNGNDIELNIVEKDSRPYASISSTDFLQSIDDERLNDLIEYFGIDVPSENSDTYRAEFLAYQLIKEIESGDGFINHNDMIEHLKNKRLGLESSIEGKISKFIAQSYNEGYVRGVHDIDGVTILEAVYPLYFSESGTATIPQSARIEGLKMLATFEETVIDSMLENLDNMNKVSTALSSPSILIEAVSQYSKDFGVSADAISYLFASIKSDSDVFSVSEEAKNLLDELTSKGVDLKSFTANLKTKAVFTQVAKQVAPELDSGYVEEAYYAIHANEIKSVGTASVYAVSDLVGNHNLIKSGGIKSDIETFISKCSNIQTKQIPEFSEFIKVRQNIANELHSELNLQDFEAKPLSNFVRNKLIKDCYLPIIGDSLARQMGSVGSNTSAQSGGLLLLSPPGYGKTTLLEYIAKILGVVFVKIDCPTIGHNVTSIMPEEADNAGSRKELEKLNMGLEMGNNVLLYLDDIQHLNSEFLQKFISLCDGTRRIEGSWKGESKTYDMRGKRFAIAMAGNPYTENGEAFKVPDMLVNRMSSYNLGDVMTGMDEAFELSYIENALTSHSVTAPLASRSQEDLYKLVRISKGEEIALSELEHNYSPAEANEITEILTQMIKVQSVVLKVNAEYIRSAAMSLRTEPPFLLQGSYRNMSKMVEKLVPAMNDEDVDALINDHYRAESQTLTTGSEQNMLRFKELTSELTDEEQERWNEIKLNFSANDISADSELTDADKVVRSINKIAESLEAMVEKEPTMKTYLLPSSRPKKATQVPEA